MKNIKIIFFDIDGTLIDIEKKQISENTLKALTELKKNGIRICIATGRAPMLVPERSSCSISTRSRRAFRIESHSRMISSAKALDFSWSKFAMVSASVLQISGAARRKNTIHFSLFALHFQTSRAGAPKNEE